MGLKVSKCGARSVHPEHLIPQGLYPLHDVDLKRLKKYILTGRLAPCFPGQEGDGDEASSRSLQPAAVLICSGCSAAQ